MQLQILVLGCGIAGPAGVVLVRLQPFVHVTHQHLEKNIRTQIFEQDG
jgi:hypothetical protein